MGVPRASIRTEPGWTYSVLMRLISSSGKSLARSLPLAFTLVAGWAVASPVVRSASDAADVAVERGEYALAARWRHQAALKSGDPAAFEAAARLAYDRSQYAVLAAICADWVKRDPQSETAHRMSAVAALELDRRDAALVELDWLVKHAYPTPDDAMESFGRSLGELHNPASVAAVMSRLADRYPDSAAGHERAGELMLVAGNAQRAFGEGQRASELGRARQGRALMARSLVVQGDCPQALSLVTALGGDAHAADKMMEAWLMTACGRDAEGEGIFQELAQRSSDRAMALEALAGRELATSRTDAAARHYRELAALGSSQAAQFGLATVAERAGDSARALSIYRSLTTGRFATQAQLRAFRLRVGQGGVDWAERLLDDFVAATPLLRPELTVGHVLALEDLGEPDRALALAERAERAYPDVDELIRVRAEVLVRAGHTDEAVRRLESLLKARPDDPAAQNALGYTLADAGRDLPRARRLITAAVAQAPDHPAYLDSLGWLQFRLADYPAAVRSLARAYRLQSDAEVAAHYTLALYANGQGEAAGTILRSALERFPADPRLLDAKARHLE